MKKRFTMKHIMIPVAIVIALLLALTVALSFTDDTPTHTHDDTVNQTEYHVHADGVTHYGEH